MNTFLTYEILFDPRERELLTEALSCHHILTKRYNTRGYAAEHFQHLLEGLSSGQKSTWLRNLESVLKDLVVALGKSIEYYDVEEVDAPSAGGPYIESPKRVAVLFKDLRLHQKRVCEEALLFVQNARKDVQSLRKNTPPESI